MSKIKFLLFVGLASIAFFHVPMNASVATTIIQAPVSGGCEPGVGDESCSECEAQQDSFEHLTAWLEVAQNAVAWQVELCEEAEPVCENEPGWMVIEGTIGGEDLEYTCDEIYYECTFVMAELEGDANMTAILLEQAEADLAFCQQTHGCGVYKRCGIEADLRLLKEF